jgi:hypothetical protein
MQTSAVSGADVRVPLLRTSALRNADVCTGTLGTSAPVYWERPHLYTVNVCTYTLGTSAPVHCERLHRYTGNVRSQTRERSDLAPVINHHSIPNIMFYTRINKIKIFNNREGFLGLFNRGAELRIYSHVSSSNGR